MFIVLIKWVLRIVYIKLNKSDKYKYKYDFLYTFWKFLIFVERKNEKNIKKSRKNMNNMINLIQAKDKIIKKQKIRFNKEQKRKNYWKHEINFYRLQKKKECRKTKDRILMRN